LQLHAAYELGRSALVDGLGVLEVAVAHQRVVRKLLVDVGRTGQPAKTIDDAGRFLVECLSPFEVSHRGIREAALEARRLNETMEKEVSRIAHAFHDEAGQLLASVHVAIADLGQDLPTPAQERLDEIRNLLKKLETELRSATHELRPLVLDDLGLLPALRFLVENVSRRSGLRVQLSGDTRGRMPSAVESALYRTVQEALTNVVKHADARVVRVRLRRNPRHVSCMVYDDGVGYPRGARAGFVPGNGLGLIGIRERAKALGGRLRIMSQRGRGTALIVRIPIGD